VTRRHFLVDHADHGAQQMISIVGGKLTTAASLARECARALGLVVLEPKGYAIRRKGNDHRQFETEIPELTGVNPRSVAAIESLFGPAAPRVLALVESDERFRQPICPHANHVVGEAVYAARNEFAITLGDILLRRVPVALGACWSEECTRIAAQRTGNAMDWSATEIAEQTNCFMEEYERFLRKPAVTRV
jgi:glycerol-3-phosphate dehydrogenase